MNFDFSAWKNYSQFFIFFSEIEFWDIIWDFVTVCSALPWKKARKSRQKILHDFTKDEKLLKKQRRISSRYILLFMCNTKFFSWWYLKIDKVGKKHLVIFEAKILMDDVMLWKLTFLDEESYQPIQTNIDGNIYFLK